MKYRAVNPVPTDLKDPFNIAFLKSFPAVVQPLFGHVVNLGGGGQEVVDDLTPVERANLLVEVQKPQPGAPDGWGYLLLGAMFGPLKWEPFDVLSQLWNAGIVACPNITQIGLGQQGQVAMPGKTPTSFNTGFYPDGPPWPKGWIIIPDMVTYVASGTDTAAWLKTNLPLWVG